MRTPSRTSTPRLRGPDPPPVRRARDQGMHVVFFDFVSHFGGAPRSTVENARRLAPHTRVSVVDAYGGCEPYARAVREAGIDYHVLCPQEARVIGGHGSLLRRAVRLAASLPDQVRLRRAAVKLLRRIGASVVSTNSTKGMATLATIRALRDLPVVGYLRGWYTPDMIPPYARWVLRRRVRAVVAVSHATRAAVTCSGVDPAKVVVVQNPIDADEVLAQADGPLGADLPQAERPLRILLPATYLRTKGQHTAVRAMGRLVQAGYDPVLYLAGDVGHFGRPEYVTDVQELSRSLGVADRVVWLGLRDDVPQLMKAASAVILPSHTEGMPRTILEAMALARPVAATPVGGILDLILPGVTGYLFEVDDDRGLAACLMRVADRPEEAARVGRRAQEFMQDTFRPADHTRKLLDLFQAVAGGSLRGGAAPLPTR